MNIICCLSVGVHNAQYIYENKGLSVNKMVTVERIMNFPVASFTNMV